REGIGSLRHGVHESEKADKHAGPVDDQDDPVCEKRHDSSLRQDASRAENRRNTSPRPLFSAVVFSVAISRWRSVSTVVGGLGCPASVPLTATSVVALSGGGHPGGGGAGLHRLLTSGAGGLDAAGRPGLGGSGLVAVRFTLLALAHEHPN